MATELNLPLYARSVITGLVPRGAPVPIYGSEAPQPCLANLAQIRGDALFLRKAFVRSLERDRILRGLRELAAGFRDWRRSVVLPAPVIRRSPGLPRKGHAVRWSRAMLRPSANLELSGCPLLLDSESWCAMRAGG